MNNLPRKTFKKVTTSPELIEKINLQNKKLIDLFLKSKGRKCSDATLKNYKSDLNIFFCWVLNNCDNKYFPDIKKFEMSDFFSYTVDELQWSGKRFARMRSTLSSLSDVFLKFFEDDYPRFRNYINSVIEPIPKEPVREKTVLSDEEIKQLLDYLDSDEKFVTEACVLALAIYSGCRISELLQFNIDTIDVNHLAYGNSFLETTHKIRTKGAGKQGKLLNKYIIKDLFLPYYNKYLQYRAEIVKKTKTDSKALFLQNTGKPIKVSTLRSWALSWENIVGKPMYIHALRHLFVTTLTKKGLSDELIISIVGWSSAEMKKIYTDIDDKDRNWDKDLSKLESFIKEEKEIE